MELDTQQSTKFNKIEQFIDVWSDELDRNHVEIALVTLGFPRYWGGRSIPSNEFQK